MSIKRKQKKKEEIEEREIIATEEDIDKNDTAYFENKEKRIKTTRIRNSRKISRVYNKWGYNFMY